MALRHIHEVHDIFAGQETISISSAAKLKGLRVIGSTSLDAKTECFFFQELGYDAAINKKSSSSLPSTAIKV